MRPVSVAVFGTDAGITAHITHRPRETAIDAE